MENLVKKNEYIPPQFYSVDGLFEIILALENADKKVFYKHFPGKLLWATKNQEKVAINDKLIEKLIITAESIFKKSMFSENDYNEVLTRIEGLKNKFEI
jgi:hypothetical protein